MGNTAKLMLVGVLALVIVIAVIWDRQSNDLQVAAVGAVPENSEEAPEPAMTGDNSDVTGQITLSEPTVEQVEAIAEEFGREYLGNGGNPVAQNAGEAAAEGTPIAVQAPAQSQVKTYITQEGDNFWELSKKFYGTAKYHLKLWEANSDRVSKPELLREGTTLIVPKFDTNRVVVSPEPAHDAQAANGERSYVVKQGDCLGIISQKFYGTSKKWQLILDANNLEDERSLRAGMKIVIPADN